MIVADGLFCSGIACKLTGEYKSGLVKFDDILYDYTFPITHFQIQDSIYYIVFAMIRMGILTDGLPLTTDELANAAYNEFKIFYDNLDANERNLLNNIPLRAGNKLMTFADTLSGYRAINYISSQIFLDLLVGMNPDFSFHPIIEKVCAEHIQIKKARFEGSYVYDYKNEINIIFVSLMTYDFYPKQSRQRIVANCLYGDISTVVPLKVYIIYRILQKKYFAIDIKDANGRNTMFDIMAIICDIEIYNKATLAIIEQSKSEFVCNGKHTGILDSCIMEPWFRALKDESIFSIYTLFESAWIINLCSNVKNTASFISVDAYSMLNIFLESLLLVRATSNMVRDNMKFLLFLKALDKIDFLYLLQCVDVEKRVDIMRTYLISKGYLSEIINNFSDVCRYVFEEELVDYRKCKDSRFFARIETDDIEKLVVYLVDSFLKKQIAIAHSLHESPLFF